MGLLTVPKDCSLYWVEVGMSGNLLSEAKGPEYEVARSGWRYPFLAASS